jgi:hypothetical protein
MGGIVRGLDAVLLKIGGIEDHAHVLASLKAKHRLDYFLRDLKADSSEWVHKEITRRFEWQKGYAAFSVSPTAVDSVARIKESIIDGSISRTSTSISLRRPVSNSKRSIFGSSAAAPPR